MYVCIELALRGIAHGKGRPNWAKGRDPSESWVQYPNPAVSTAPRHSRWNVLAHPSALSEPTLLWAAKGVLCPHVGGTVTHRAHRLKMNVAMKLQKTEMYSHLVDTYIGLAYAYVFYTEK